MGGGESILTARHLLCGREIPQPMFTPLGRRLVIVCLSLAAGALACARADLPISPVTPDYATRQPPTATSTPLPPTPTVLAPTATLSAVTDTAEAQATPTAGGSELTNPPADTPVPPVDTPDTSAPAVEVPTDTPVPAVEAPTDTPVPAVEVPTDTPAPTLEAPTDTPVPPTETPTTLPTIPPQTIQTVSIPADATFTQLLTITGEGGELLGDPGYLIDGRTVTWAALDGGHTTWTFDLGSPQKIGGLSLYAQKPRTGDATNLLAIEVSNDGQTWQAVFVGSGNCGEVNCDSLPQMKYTNIGFNPVSARYVRLRSGPNRFAFAEVAVAIVP